MGALVQFYLLILLCCTVHDALMNLSFPVLLILASQRIEDIIGWDLPSDTTKRGSLPSVVEYCILAWVAGNEDPTKRVFWYLVAFLAFFHAHTSFYEMF